MWFLVVSLSIVGDEMFCKFWWLLRWLSELRVLRCDRIVVDVVVMCGGGDGIFRVKRLVVVVVMFL